MFMQEVLSTALTNAILASVFAIIVFAITRVVKAPSLARALWILVLAKLVTPPLFVAPISFPDLAVENPERLSEKVTAWPSDTTASVPERESETVSLSGPVLVHGADLEKVTGAARSQRVDTEAAEGKYRRAGSKQATSSESDQPIVDWAVLVGSLWGAGSGLLFLVLLVRTARFQRLLRQAGKAPDSTQELAQELAGRIGLRRLPEMRVVDARVSPFVWSFGLRPKVILPRNLLGSLEEEDLSLVLTHELSHIKRGDHWVRWFETAPLLLFWWCPVVWFVRRELRLAEEQCSDASVTELFPDSNCRYVETLVSVCDLQGRRCASDFALRFNESSTTRRCRMILDQKNVRSRLGLFTTLCLSCAAILLLPLSADVFGQTDKTGKLDLVQLNTGKLDLVQLKPGKLDLVQLKPGKLDLVQLKPIVENKSLESRLQRLEKLVEKLLGALDTRPNWSKGKGLAKPNNAPGASNEAANQLGGVGRLPQDAKPTYRDYADVSASNPTPGAIDQAADRPGGVGRLPQDAKLTDFRDADVGASNKAADRPGGGANERKQIFERLEAIDKAIEKLNLERRQLLNSPLLQEGEKTPPVEK